MPARSRTEKQDAEAKECGVPELPEVETVMRGLQPFMEGKRLVRVEQRRPDLRWPLPVDFVARLEGRRGTSMTQNTCSSIWKTARC